ncbi:M50 family metallopeptidase [Actinomycetospora sp. CA-101289]|uniref:M50 family metallopeptidase n=1 Tax=Actinomycetospora sp. CA-101289 TaxID=3239893 RepID=UPI003D9919FF
MGVNDVLIVGEPVAYGTGFIALLLVLLSRYLSNYPITLAHEGGHMLALFVTLRGNLGWTMDDNADGATRPRRGGLWLFTLAVFFVGYAAPPLLGLAAAALIAVGNPFAVLMIAIVLSVLAVARSRNGLAFLVPALIVVGFGWALIGGSVAVQAALAVGLAWLLLLGGLVDAVRLLQAPSSDGAQLARRTLIPNVVWSLAWVFLAVTTLIVGGQLLLRPGYTIG